MAIVTYPSHFFGVSNTTFDYGTPLTIYNISSPFSILQQSNGVITQLGGGHVGPSGTTEWIISGSFSSTTNGTITGITATSSSPPSHGGDGAVRTVFTYTELNIPLSHLIQAYQNGNAFESTHAFVIEALKASDSVTGTRFNDTLLGYEGNDTVRGSTEEDAAADGADNLLGNEGSDVVYGYAGDDSISGGVNVIDPADSADTLYGGAGHDTIYGCGGNDVIYGEAGNELIVAGNGNDTVTGGTGNDVFVHILNGGEDLIIDFQQGDILTIERTATVFDYASAISQGISDVNGSYIDLGGGNGILLASGVQLSSLDAADFYFYG